jgi:hypothetical protein
VCGGRPHILRKGGSPMKKEYTKPQVIEVKLTLQNPIMGDCELLGSGDLIDGDSYCSTTGHCEGP